MCYCNCEETECDPEGTPFAENWRICITAAEAGGFQPKEARFDFDATVDL